MECTSALLKGTLEGIRNTAIEFWKKRSGCLNNFLKNCTAAKKKTILLVGTSLQFIHKEISEKPFNDAFFAICRKICSLGYMHRRAGVNAANQKHHFKLGSFFHKNLPNALMGIRARVSKIPINFQFRKRY